MIREGYVGNYKIDKLPDYIINSGFKCLKCGYQGLFVVEDFCPVCAREVVGFDQVPYYWEKDKIEVKYGKRSSFGDEERKLIEMNQREASFSFDVGVGLLKSIKTNKEYSLFIRDYNSVIHKIYNCNLQQEVCKWLKGEENECILELLRWCNGHLLWKHLILNFGNMFNVTSDRELTDKFFHHIKENKAKLCKNPPLSLYLEFLEND